MEGSICDASFFIFFWKKMLMWNNQLSRLDYWMIPSVVQLVLRYDNVQVAPM